MRKRLVALHNANATEANLQTAKEAWYAARVPYQQSEVFRFGNRLVDDWEGQVNAWPLDEGLIDYVESDGYQYELGNAGATANIIASNSINVGGEQLDVSTLTAELLADLNEIGGSEANVASGYHAIEFLLWGQDLNGFGAGSGEPPISDYQQGTDCTNGNCNRRADYLDAVTDLLIDDLEWMTAQWAEGSSDNYRAQLTSADASEGVQKMLFGMGSLSLGELAGERMKVALEANSYEDEHDCAPALGQPSGLAHPQRLVCLALTFHRECRCANVQNTSRPTLRADRQRRRRTGLQRYSRFSLPRSTAQLFPDSGGKRTH